MMTLWHRVRGKPIVFGLIWVSIATVISKLGAMLTQVVLGWYLSPEQYGLFAIAIAWSTFLLVIRNAGTTQLLIQRGREDFDNLQATALSLSVLFNLVGFILIVLLGFLIGEIKDLPSLSLLFVLIGLSLPLATLVGLLQAKLAIEQQYAAIANVTMYSALAKYLLTIILVVAGFDELALVIPLPIVALLESVLLYRLAPMQFSLRWDVAQVKRVLPNCAWIIFAGLGIALAMNGDYMVVSVLKDERTLGIYFFGFQLIVAMTNTVSTSFRSVLMPSFANLSDSHKRVELFRQAMFFVSSFSVVVSVYAYVYADELIRFIWDNRWEESIVVVRFLALIIVFRMFSPLARSYMEAMGRWRQVSLLVWFDALGTMLAIACGAIMGGLQEICLSYLLFKVIYCVIYSFVLVNNLIPWHDLLINFWGIIVVALVLYVVMDTMFMRLGVVTFHQQWLSVLSFSLLFLLFGIMLNKPLRLRLAAGMGISR